MTLSLKHKHWITTDKQIRDIVKKCRKCWKITNDGQLILPYDNIRTVKISGNKRTYILNTNSINDPETRIGHWISLHIDMKNKQAVLFDSLNSIRKQHPIVYNYLNDFCKKQGIYLHVLKLRTQQTSSVTCGLHSVWFTNKSHHSSINALLKLPHLFSAYTIAKREKHVLSNIDSLFFRHT